MNFCTGCGSQLQDQVRFCQNCGAPVGNTSAPTPVMHIPLDYTIQGDNLQIIRIRLKLKSLPMRKIVRPPRQAE